MKSFGKNKGFSKVALSILLAVLLMISPMAGHAEGAGGENMPVSMNESGGSNLTEQGVLPSSEKISITIQLTNTTKFTGDPDPRPGIVLRVGTLLPGDTLASLPLTYGRTAGETVGSYPTWCTYTGDVYNVKIVRGVLTIKPGRVPRP